MKIRLFLLIMFFSLMKTQRSFDSLEIEGLRGLNKKPHLSADSIDYEGLVSVTRNNLSKRNGDQGLRLSLTNNIDILRERLFNAISSNRKTEKEEPEEPEVSNDADLTSGLKRKVFLINLARAKAKLSRRGRENSGLPLYFIRSNAGRKRISPFTFRGGRRPDY